MGIYLTSGLTPYLPPAAVIPASLVLVLVLTVALGFCIERVAYKPLRSAPRMSVMISAIGVSYLLQNTATYVTGGQPMTYPTLPFLGETVTIAGTPIKWVVHPHQVGGHPHPLPGGGPGDRPHPADQPHQDRHGYAGGGQGL